jgi:hypothetical protein
MPKFRDLQSLLSHVKKQALDTLQNEVSEVVKQNMSDTIIEETYTAYESDAFVPYERRGLDGGLADTSNMVVKKIGDNTIIIRNLTIGNSKYPSYDDEPIDRIIVSGVGYRWTGSKIYRLQPFPRDFYSGTKVRLKRNNDHIKAFKEGMKKRGISIK